MEKQKRSESSKIELSVAIATFNEEKNIGKCLKSVKDIADEIVVVDGFSTDKTVEIAKACGAKVTITDNPSIFHINKQKALDLCSGTWILQLDADEEVSNKLAEEIKTIIDLSVQELEKYEENLSQKILFLRHQKLLEKRDGQIGTEKGEYCGFFIPRLNFFLGKYLRYGGVYPDGVIRLIKNGFAKFPSKNVHEQISINGRVGWLENNLIHWADPTFSRYLERNSKYIDLLKAELEREKVGKNPRQLFNYFLIKPAQWFFLTLFRHKGFLDGFRGVIFSFFSALRYPRAYFRYLKS